MEGDLPLCNVCGGSGKAPPSSPDPDCAACGGTGNAVMQVGHVPPPRDPRKMSVADLLRQIDAATERMGRSNPNRLLLEQCRSGLMDLSERLAEMMNKERRRKATQGRILT